MSPTNGREGAIMINFLRLLTVNLRLHDGEGSGGSGAASSGGDTGVPAGDIGSQNTATGKKGEKSKPVIMYGKQDNDGKLAETGTDTGTEYDANTQKVAKTPEQRKQEFQALRNSEYKDLFDAEIQNIINKRFRETKTVESQLASINPIIELLTEKYGTADIAQLVAKVKEDSIGDLADAAGMTVEQYETVMNIRQENKALKEKQANFEAEQKINSQVKAWNEQAEALKAKYPNLNLADEAKNDQFMSLLKSGVTVDAAYKVCHMDEIIAGTAKTVESNIIQDIKAKGSRPTESAARGTGGVIIKSDPSQLTREDRAEIAKKVMRGEKITF